jgi:hypothetical protein
MLKVNKRFRDKETLKIYDVGDSYSHEDDKRIAFLLKKGLLEESKKSPEDDEFPKHTGGGHYELSNGEKVKGKEDAEKAQAALESGE